MTIKKTLLNIQDSIVDAIGCCGSKETLSKDTILINGDQINFNGVRYLVWDYFEMKNAMRDYNIPFEKTQEILDKLEEYKIIVKIG